MPIKIKKNRTYTINYVDKDDPEISFKVICKFQPSEDTDISEIRDKLSQYEDLRIDPKLKNDEKAKAILIAKKMEESEISTDYILRKSIVGIEGFLDEDTGEELRLVKEDGSIDDYVQKIVFDTVKIFPLAYMDMLIAYLGPKGKNLKTGAMEQSTGAGHSESV